jgi:hypothetical protein
LGNRGKSRKSQNRGRKRLNQGNQINHINQIQMDLPPHQNKRRSIVGVGKTAFAHAFLCRLQSLRFAKTAKQILIE